MSTIGWMTTAVMEIVLFLMVFWKARKDKRQKTGMSAAKNDIETHMARDSTLYFAVYALKFRLT